MAAPPTPGIQPPLAASQPAPRVPLVPTGNPVLDDGLGGGMPPGVLLQVEGETGAGAVEFALSLLRWASQSGRATGRFASILRSPTRIQREADALFGEGHRIVPVALPPNLDPARCLVLANEMGPGDMLVLESLSGIGHAVGAEPLVALVRSLAEAAERAQAIVMVLHTPGSLPEGIEARVREAADGTFAFTWRDGGSMRRRYLRVGRLRGLAPLLEAEEVPVFEVGLRRGTGFSISRVKNVL